MQCFLAPARSAGGRLNSVCCRAAGGRTLRRVLGAMGLALAMHLFTPVSLAYAQTADLRLQLLNGRTGRPLTHVRVSLWRDMNRTPLAAGAPQQVTTDGEGYASIPVNDSEFIVIFAENRQPCSKTFEHTYSLTAVRERGLVSENSCSAHIHTYADQGTLVVFSRDLTWYERLRR